MSSDWIKMPFTDAVTDASGGNEKTPQKVYEATGEYPIVDQGKSLIGGYTNDPSQLCRAELPVIVFGDHTRCLKYVDFPFCMGADGVKVLRPKVDLDVKYLYEYLNHLRLPNHGYDRHFKYLKRFDVAFPPLSEQKRIAEILDRAEALRAKRRAALALLDELTQSIFLDMFGDPVTNPKGWKTGYIGDLLSVKHGFAFKSEFFADRGPFVLLTPGNFYETGGYRDRGEKQKFYVGPIPDGYVLESNDLLVAMTEQAPGLLGSPILIPSSNQFLHNQRLGLLDLTDQADRHFVYALFNNPAIRNRIQASSTGTKVKHTSPTKITSIEAPIPPLELQKDFAERILSITRLQKSYLLSVMELDQLFASLQHRAFRGEL